MNKIPAADRGFLLGDGVFETLIASRGKLIRAIDHHERLIKACQVLDLPGLSFLEFEDYCHTALASANLLNDRAVVRLSLSAGSGGRGLVRPETLQPFIQTQAFIAPPPPSGLRVVLSPIRRNETSPSAYHKTLNYLDNVMVRHFAIKKGADDGLMLNSKDDICCLSAANLFWFEGASLCTPPIDCGILAGITRQRIIDFAADLGLKPSEVTRTYSPRLFADGAFGCNSVIGAVPIFCLDGCSVPVNPLVADIQRLLEIESYTLKL